MAYISTLHDDAKDLVGRLEAGGPYKSGDNLLAARLIKEETHRADNNAKVIQGMENRIRGIAEGVKMIRVK